MSGSPCDIILDMPEEGVCGLPREFFIRAARETLSRCGIASLKGRSIAVSVDEADEENIARLSFRHFGKDKPTDILSFPAYETASDIAKEHGDEVFLGEMVLCEAVIRRDAESDGVSYERAMAFVFSHGILHLLGFDHGEEMFGIQDDVADVMQE